MSVGQCNQEVPLWRVIYLEMMDMVYKIVGVALLIVVVTTMSGCGNSEVEARAYEWLGGETYCDHCKTQNPLYRAKSSDPLDPFGSPSSAPQYTHESHPIKEVSSTKGPVDNCWIVTISYVCPKAGEMSHTYEMIYRDKRVRKFEEK